MWKKVLCMDETKIKIVALNVKHHVSEKPILEEKLFEADKELRQEWRFTFQ